MKTTYHQRICKPLPINALRDNWLSDRAIRQSLGESLFDVIWLEFVGRHQSVPGVGLSKQWGPKKGAFYFDGRTVWFGGPMPRSKRERKTYHETRTDENAKNRRPEFVIAV